MTPAHVEKDTDNAKRELYETAFNWIQHTPADCRECNLCKNSGPIIAAGGAKCTHTRTAAKLRELRGDGGALVLVKEADPELMAGDIAALQKQGFNAITPLIWARDIKEFRLIMHIAKRGGAK